MTTQISQEIFIKECFNYLNKLSSSDVNIDKAACLCVESIKKGGHINVFGVGHSSGFAMEMVNSQNGLLPIRSITPIDLVLKGKMTISEYNDRNNKFAQRENLANELYNLYDFSNSDIFILISNSGINKLIIDFAEKLKQSSFVIIVVTSLEHTSAVESRHLSGKKLKDFGDVVIDNVGPLGDTLIGLGNSTKICSISSITSALIAQTLSCKIQEAISNRKYDS